MFEPAETRGLMQALLTKDSGTAGSFNHRDEHGLLEGSLTVPFVNFQMEELGILNVLVWPLKGTEYAHARTHARTHVDARSGTWECLLLLDHMEGGGGVSP